jgi:hypothetical protein
VLVDAEAESEGASDFASNLQGQFLIYFALEGHFSLSSDVTESM